MITRDFDAMLAEKIGNRPTFKVAGQDFTLRSKLPFAKWYRLLAVMQDDNTDPFTATAQFFDTVLIRADRARFRALLDQDDSDDDNDDGVIDMSQMNDITDWVMEYFTGKHLNSSNGSTPGADGTGQPPNVVSLSARTTAS